LVFGFQLHVCNWVSVIAIFKKALRETQTLRAGCSKAEIKKISLRRRTLSGGAGRPKFN